MTFRYVGLDEAISCGGLRMVVVGEVPSPWGEAAKGLLHIKGIAWVAVRLDSSEALRAWTGRSNAPVAMYENEKPRSGWAEILLLTERLAPARSLLPADPSERALVFGLAHEICGEVGLGWSRRLQLVHAGLQNDGGFPERVAKYLAGKYGYGPDVATTAGPRATDVLRMLANRLEAQRKVGSSYYVGHALTAADVYSATFMALFRPLPPEQCKMRDSARAALERRDAATEAALSPILLDHRDMMYSRHLELPLAL